jgi:hypothetical protein
MTREGKKIEEEKEEDEEELEERHAVDLQSQHRQDKGVAVGREGQGLESSRMLNDVRPSSLSRSNYSPTLSLLSLSCPRPSPSPSPTAEQALPLPPSPTLPLPLDAGSSSPLPSHSTPITPTLHTHNALRPLPARLRWTRISSYDPPVPSSQVSLPSLKRSLSSRNVGRERRKRSRARGPLKRLDSRRGRVVGRRERVPDSTGSRESVVGEEKPF